VIPHNTTLPKPTGKEASAMLENRVEADKFKRFAETPWNLACEQWQALDRRLPADHLARRLVRAVELLDLAPLLNSYLGAGRKPLRPDLLLLLVLYERQNKQPSPARWTRDVRESEPVRWLLFGMEPSRAALYDFRDRIAPFLQAWNEEVVAAAVAQDMTRASRAALDSSSIAANAARKPLLNDERLQKRRGVIEEGVRAMAQGGELPKGPAWRARTPAGLRQQKRRYQRAAEIMAERQQANARRRPGKRKPMDKVRISPSDPEATLALDKLKVFRPLYNAVLLRDLDSQFILAYDVVSQNNDNGTLEPLVEQMTDAVGHKPEQLLADSGFASLHDLQFCAANGITLYSPCQENDYSKKQAKKAQSNQHTTLPKSAFAWLPEARTYRCPQGHLLEPSGATRQQRLDHRVTLHLYRCPPEHCQKCPSQPECTRTPQKGRTVSRMENEELLDELRQRMAGEEVKKLYKLRSQTVELSYADMKEHRDLRRFHGRGLSRAQCETGALVLSHNLLEHERTRRIALTALGKRWSAPLPQTA
jgi:hypothetical protein